MQTERIQRFIVGRNKLGAVTAWRSVSSLFAVTARCLLRPTAVLLIVATQIFAQEAEQPLDGAKLDGTSGRDLALDQFRPESQLVLPQETVRRAKFPVVDVHVHCRLKMRQSPEVVDEFVRLMDDQNIAVCNSLDGGLGERFTEHRKFLYGEGDKYKNRFTIFANIDWIGDGKKEEPATWDCHRPDFGRRMALALADAKQRGAAGLKIHKMLGLYFRNPDGSYMKVDDPRWDPIWKACGELGLPVLIHTADPVAFFQPIDATNERWEELNRHPNWGFSGGPPNNYTGPSHDELLAARNRVFARQPKTQFIAAHVANYPENLAKVGDWLDTYPNMHVEIAARIAELGRQPRTARKFFLKYQDRILFGTDGPRSPGRLRPHWRLLETDHEYFSYAEGQYPPQGLWDIYGLDLPDKVLRKVYHKNAAKLIAGVAERLEKLRNTSFRKDSND